MVGSAVCSCPLICNVDFGFLAETTTSPPMAARNGVQTLDAKGPPPAEDTEGDLRLKCSVSGTEFGS